MTDIVERLRKENSMPPYYGPPKLQEDAAARIEQLEAALREIVAMDEVAIVDFKKGDGWLHQRVARAALAAPSGALEERT